MSNEVKRYDPINSDGTCGMCIEDADYGAYVEYADYAALEAELAKLRAELEPVAIPDSDGLYVVSIRDNWDGEGDVYTLLARKDEKGEWYSDESGKPLLHCEGDAVLRVWSLTEQAPQPSAVPAESGLDADDVRAACQNAIEVFAGEENAEQCREVAEYMREVLLADLDRAAPRQPEGGHGWLVSLELPEVQCNCAWNPDSHDKTCPVYLRDRLSDAQRAIAELTDRNTKLCATINRMVAEGVLICDERDTLRQQLAERDAQIASMRAEVTPFIETHWMPVARQRDKLADLLQEVVSEYVNGTMAGMSALVARIDATLDEVK